MAIDSTHFIAFAEGRKNNATDSGDIDLIQKRITFDRLTNNLTVGPIEVVAPGTGNTRGNPTPLLIKQGARAGRLLLFYNGNIHSDVERLVVEGKSKDVRRAYLRYSDDGGLTYSPEQEITSARKPDWRWHAFGPSNGIQMVGGLAPNRLVIPGNYSDASKIFHSFLLLSDDNGETFYIGAISSKDSSGEISIAEFALGNIYASMRTGHDAFTDQPAFPTEGARWIGISTDGGLSFSQEYRESAAPSGSVHGGATVLSENDRGLPVLVLSAPPNKGRTNLTLHATEDGKTFFNRHQVTNGSSGYSNMLDLGRNLLGLFYEFTDENGKFHAKIVVYDVADSYRPD
ncbi:MAG: sialidase family protein [Pseudomonadota bacterium]